MKERIYVDLEKADADDLLALKALYRAATKAETVRRAIRDALAMAEKAVELR